MRLEPASTAQLFPSHKRHPRREHKRSAELQPAEMQLGSRPHLLAMRQACATATCCMVPALVSPKQQDHLKAERAQLEAAPPTSHQQLTIQGLGENAPCAMCRLSCD
eukprot:CAMPEP_0204411290 /NCGR_PEP_ID=MMETSP0470-20130426/11265_1 /ASSEMBLY_ACC=CAM_ASM_000385 /TAXON_ID=2969 /ORGANISM="Oxyrrhis marina" /LENGTH=106 /DNA_ID=CAMNT_0051407249 /DNA_START=93 /DNA_END=411 /DNA_ORIENTATION=-